MSYSDYCPYEYIYYGGGGPEQEKSHKWYGRGLFTEDDENLIVTCAELKVRYRVKVKKGNRWLNLK